ncbi:hypothetical protein DH86_00001019 [Scytalidium sp. 3C]|nr:hypothetical protein DH86_00001019 [Scytalidium sp. 3C]
MQLLRDNLTLWTSSEAEPAAETSAAPAETKEATEAAPAEAKPEAAE